MITCSECGSGLVDVGTGLCARCGHIQDRVEFLQKSINAVAGAFNRVTFLTDEDEQKLREHIARFMLAKKLGVETWDIDAAIESGALVLEEKAPGQFLVALKEPVDYITIKFVVEKGVADERG